VAESSLLTFLRIALEIEMDRSEKYEPERSISLSK
jgi:hypothetical protein